MNRYEPLVEFYNIKKLRIKKLASKYKDIKYVILIFKSSSVVNSSANNVISWRHSRHVGA